MDDEDEFVLLLQLMLAEQQGDEFEDELLACVGLVCYGLEEARQLSVLRRSLQRLYLTRADLLPDPCTLPGRHVHFIIAKVTGDSSPL